MSAERILKGAYKFEEMSCFFAFLIWRRSRFVYMLVQNALVYFDVVIAVFYFDTFTG